MTDPEPELRERIHDKYHLVEPDCCILPAPAVWPRRSDDRTGTLVRLLCGGEPYLGVW